MKPSIRRRSRLVAVACSLACAWPSIPTQAQVLLSYWNFNNDSPSYSSPNLGSFSTGNAGYGEVYSGISTHRLSSNTGNDAVFSGSSVYIDLANLAETTAINNQTINGLLNGTGQRQTTSTGAPGYGVFLGSTINQAGTDSTGSGGSLIIMNPPGNFENGHYITLSLSSAGYQDLALSYAGRITNTPAGNLAMETWSWSVDGVNFTDVYTVPAGTISTSSFNLVAVDLSGVAAIDNQETFYLRMTVIQPGGSSGPSFAFDNIQLTGVAVPEPSAYALLGIAGLAGVMVWWRRRRVASGDAMCTLSFLPASAPVGARRRFGELPR